QDVLSAHFPGGLGSPTQVVVSADELEGTARAIGDLDGVESTSVTTEDSPRGTATVTADGEIEAAPSQGPPTGDAGSRPDPTTVDGQVLLDVTLSDAADSLAAEETVTDIRDAVHPIDADALVGGETAVDLDTNTTAEADRALAIPLILLVVTIVLTRLLRSRLAPLMLGALTVRALGAPLGVQPRGASDSIVC